MIANFHQCVSFLEIDGPKNIALELLAIVILRANISVVHKLSKKKLKLKPKKKSIHRPMS